MIIEINKEALQKKRKIPPYPVADDEASAAERAWHKRPSSGIRVTNTFNPLIYRPSLVVSLNQQRPTETHSALPTSSDFICKLPVSQYLLFTLWLVYFITVLDLLAPCCPARCMCIVYVLLVYRMCTLYSKCTVSGLYVCRAWGGGAAAENQLSLYWISNSPCVFIYPIDLCNNKRSKFISWIFLYYIIIIIAITATSYAVCLWVGLIKMK